jgi:hypothetical protein
MTITRLGPNQDITAAKIAGTINFKNIIINGDMSLAQRGTSVSGLTNGSSQYLIDRFKWYEGGSPTYQFTMSQDTDVPTGQGLAKSLKLDCTTAQGSLGAGDQNILWQRIEGQNLQQLKYGTSSAESLTLSFWVKSSKTGTYIVELYQPDGTRGISKAYTISASNTWEKKTITYAGDTSGTINNDNGAGLDVYFFLSAGSNYQSGTLATSWQGYSAGDECVGQVNLADSTDNNWWITGVQLEVGTSASDFEFLPYDVNLQRCQRYYWKETSSPNVANQWTAVGGVSQTNVGRVMMFLPTPMRTIPTSLGTSGTAGDYKIQNQNTGEICNAVPSFVSANYDKIQFNLQTAASMTPGYYCALRYNAAGVGYLEVDVEL